jgi:hypothetical protein
MNERIKQLAERAIEETESRKGTGMVLMDAYTQRLAELILKECITVVDSTPLGYGDYRDQILESMRDSCSDRIANHFGVE